MPRVSDAKEKLTEAALGLIWTSGYGATSVDDICAKADVRKGSFYHFFKSKADLEVAALEFRWQHAQLADRRDRERQADHDAEHQRHEGRGQACGWKPGTRHCVVRARSALSYQTGGAGTDFLAMLREQ